MSRNRQPRKPGWWVRVRRNKAQLLFWILGLLVVLSMVLSLVIVALPQPEPPTPTPTPLSWRWEVLMDAGSLQPMEALPFLRAGV